MNISDFREYCVAKKGVTEDFPFDKSTLVFKVMNKMFALTNIDALAFTANLKCDPEKAIELRAQYDGVNPGYHMNKKHWNTIDLENDLSSSLIYELIDHSYDLVVKGLKKADRIALELLD